MVAMSRAPPTGTDTRPELPERTLSPLTQVARTLTVPRFAGTLGSTQVPPGCTGAVRLSALTMQVSSSCAAAGRGRASAMASSKSHVILVMRSPGSSRAQALTLSCLVDDELHPMPRGEGLDLFARAATAQGMFARPGTQAAGIPLHSRTGRETLDEAL